MQSIQIFKPKCILYQQLGRCLANLPNYSTKPNDNNRIKTQSELIERLKKKKQTSKKSNSNNRQEHSPKLSFSKFINKPVESSIFTKKNFFKDEIDEEKKINKLEYKYIKKVYRYLPYQYLADQFHRILIRNI